MQQKWIMLDKSGGQDLVLRSVDSVEDKVGMHLQAVADGRDIPAAEVAAMKKRKLISTE